MIGNWQFLPPIAIVFRDMVVDVDMEHSESLVSADRSGLSTETVTLDGMDLREPFSMEDFEISFRSEDIS